MTNPSSSPLGNVSTYTHLTADGSATEVLLIPLDCTELGRDNSYPPPEPDAENFSNWARRGYFFLNGDVVVQLPRNADDLPLDQNASEVTDVVARDGFVEAYYPVNREKAVSIIWDYATDEWRAEYTDCTLRDGTVQLDDLGENGTIIWSVNAEKYTE